MQLGDHVASDRDQISGRMIASNIGQLNPSDRVELSSYAETIARSFVLLNGLGSILEDIQFSYFSPIEVPSCHVSWINEKRNRCLSVFGTYEPDKHEDSSLSVMIYRTDEVTQKVIGTLSFCLFVASLSPEVVASLDHTSPSTDFLATTKMDASRLDEVLVAHLRSILIGDTWTDKYRLDW